MDNINKNNTTNGLDGSIRSQHGTNNDESSTTSSHPNNINTAGGTGAGTDSYLGGSFAGGWQSNADLPDRRRIIFTILEVIRLMRPDTNRIAQK